MNFSQFNLTEQDWHFTVGIDALNVRRSPSLSGEVVAVYGNDEVINYYGIRNYVATGKFIDGVNNCTFGSFEQSPLFYPILEKFRIDFFV